MNDLYLSRAGKIRETRKQLGPPEDFILDLTVMEGLLQDDMDLFVKGFTQTVANEIHSGGKYSPGTPIDTGFARANWVGGINADGPAPGLVASTVRVAGEFAVQAGASLAQMEDIALTAKAGDTVYLTNNAHYIGDLEDGTSLQAPNGMIKQAVGSGQLIADEVATHILASR